jgi:hypothetical protein
MQFPISRATLQYISKQNDYNILEKQAKERIIEIIEEITQNVIIAATRGHTQYKYDLICKRPHKKYPKRVLYGVNICYLEKPCSINQYITDHTISKNIVPDIVSSLKQKFPDVTILIDSYTNVVLDWS